MKHLVEISHLIKFDALRVSRHQALDLETWFRIHANITEFGTDHKNHIKS